LSRAEVLIATARPARKVAGGYGSLLQDQVMNTKKLLLTGWLLVASLLIAVEFRPLRADQGGKFDKLSAEDRKAHRERFQKEIWPLFMRNEKDGCVGCHATKKGSLRMSGDAAKDFNMLVAEGYMLKGDPGSMLERILDKDKKRRMPPDGKPGWSEAEIKLLREFVNDLDKKNKL